MDRSLSLSLALFLVASSSVATAQDGPPEQPRPRPTAPAKKKAPPPPEVVEDAPAPEDDPLEAMSVPATELEPQADDADADASDADASDADASDADTEAVTKTKRAPAAKKQPPRVKARAVVSVTAVQPEVLPYEEGQTIPEGYTPDTRPRTGLIIGGAITFLVPYLSSVAIAYGAQRDARHGDMSRHEAEELSPLYVPIAGPFIAIGTADRDSAAEIAPFVASGLVQAAGAGMLLAGIFSRKQVLVRKQASVTPLVSAGTLGLSASGSF